VTDATRMTAGIRYTQDERTLNATRIGFNGATGVWTSIVTPQQEVSFGNPSWRLSLDHRFSEQLMGYVSYNRGFRGGTFVPQANPLIILEPEVLDAFEAGIKSDLFDRRVRFNLAGFYYDQSTVQVQQVIAGVQNIYSARDGAKIYGADADFTVQVTDDFRLFGGFSWVHARYNSFTDAIISMPFPLAATTPPFSTTQFSYVDSATGQTMVNTACLGTFVPPPAANTQPGRDAFYRSRLGGNCLLRGDASGNKLQNTPEFTFSLGANWDIESSVGLFTLGGNLYYNDGYVGTADERVAQKSFTTLNATVTWRSIDEKFFIRLWGNNLSNAFYRTQINATNSGDNGTAGAPRTYGVTAGFDF
jgi:iron complex outermembrane recepter protein